MACSVAVPSRLESRGTRFNQPMVTCHNHLKTIYASKMGFHGFYASVRRRAKRRRPQRVAKRLGAGRSRSHLPNRAAGTCFSGANARALSGRTGYDEPAFEVLSKAGVSYEFHVSSAHRQPDQTADLVKGAREKGFRVVIAGAGLSAALPGLLRVAVLACRA